MASPLDRCVLRLQGINYSGSGNWLDEMGNGLDAVISGAPTFSVDTWTFDGVDDYLSIPDNALLDFALTDDFTLMAIMSITDATPGSNFMMIGKGNTNNAVNSYTMYQTTGGGTFVRCAGDAGSALDASPTNMTDGVEIGCALVYDATADTLEAFHNGTGSGSAGADTSTVTFANSFDFTIATRGAKNAFAAMTVRAVALWDEALSDADALTAYTDLDAGYGVGGGLMLLDVG